MSLLEAMSAGCVPIVSDLKVSKEWIEEGKNGIIYDKIQNPISEALKLSAKEVCKINKKIIEKKGTKEIATEKFYEIYQQLKTTK